MDDIVPPRDPLTHPVAVAANARGEIAPRQRTALRAVLARRMLAALAGLVAALLTFALAPQAVSITLMPVLALVVAAVFFASSHALLRSVQAWRALARGAVAEGDCVVEWRDGKCEVRLDGARLEAAEPVRLLPGAHRLYYLAGTAWLLSAEARQACSLVEALAQANGLPREPRTAGAPGRLTRAEASYLLRSMFAAAAGGMLVVALWFGVLFVLLLLWSQGEVDVWPCALAELLFITVFFWGLFRYGPRLVWHAMHLYADLRAGDVAMLTGEVQRKCRRTPYQRSLAYSYEIEGVCFDVTRLGYQALVPELRYRICYAPRSRTLLSIVPVPADRIADPTQLWHDPVP